MNCHVLHTAQTCFCPLHSTTAGDSSSLLPPGGLLTIPVEVLARAIEFAGERPNKTWWSYPHDMDKMLVARVMRATCTHTRAATVEWMRSVHHLRLFGTGMDDMKLEALAHSFPVLTHLHISLTYRTVTDVGIRAFAKCGTHLTHVELHHTNVTDVAVQALARACPSLTTVEVSHTIGVSDVGIEALGAGCPLLSYVDLKHTNVGDAGICALAAGCPLLSHVDLNNTSVGDDGICALAAHCELLERVHLILTHVGDVGVEALARCPRLCCIQLHSTNVKDHGIMKFTQGGRPLKLKLIGVEHTTLTCVGVIALALRCPALTEIYLDHTCVSNLGVVALAKWCPMLSTIVLSNNSRIKDVAMLALVECAELTFVDVLHTSVTEDGVRHLAAECCLPLRMRITWNE